MEEIQLSVIMSVYNAEHNYLKKSIKSILNQTYEKFEFIIIDDASENNIESVIELFDDSRIIFLKNDENLGLTKSLNKAINISKGRYIARIDADDVAYPYRFDRQLTYMKEHPRIGVLGSQAKIIGNRVGKLNVSTSHEDIRASLILKSQMVHPSVIIKGDLLRQNLYNENFRTGQDYELWSRLIWQTQFENLNSKLIKYRIHRNQLTSRSKVSQDDNAKKVRKKMIKKLDDGLSNEKLQLLLDSTSGKTLNEFELQTLVVISNILLNRNRIKKMFNDTSLAKVLSENLDYNIFRYSRNTGKKIRTKVSLQDNHIRNKYTFKTKISKLYYFYDNIKKSDNY